MRPSLQKTMLVALAAAIASSALGVSGEGIGATGKPPPVRIVVLPRQPAGTVPAQGGLERLLNGARLARSLESLSAAGAADARLPVADARGAFVERVRRGLLESSGQDRR